MSLEVVCGPEAPCVDWCSVHSGDRTTDMCVPRDFLILEVVGGLVHGVAGVGNVAGRVAHFLVLMFVGREVYMMGFEPG